jgi:hypothetical protein
VACRVSRFYSGALSAVSTTVIADAHASAPGCRVGRHLVLGGRLHRQIGGLLTLEYAIDVASRASVLVVKVRTVGYQAAAGDEVAERIDRGQLGLGCQRAD